MFLNRQQAGQRLAEELKKYKGDKDAIVLAIPNGGVLVAKPIAESLNLNLDLIVVKKLPMPDQPEAGIGAISETGEIVFQPQAKFYNKETVDKILAQQKKEIETRIRILRSGRGLPDLENRTVILVDDGIAMGSTMEVAIKTVKKKKTARIIVAVPITGPRQVQKFKSIVDEFICPLVPRFFYAVAQGYQNWRDISCQEVIETLKK